MKILNLGQLRSLLDNNAEALLLAGRARPGDVAAAYSSVAWVARCATLRATALASIPWAVVDADENEIEHPLEHPLALMIPDIEYSLCLFGAAYILKLRRGSSVVDLQLLNPQTVSVIANARQGLVGFRQNVGEMREYTPDDIVYIRLYNPSDDVGPGVSPARIALEAANLSSAAMSYLNEYFSNGAIPAMILTTEQPLAESEIERLRAWWNKTFRGEGKRHRTGILQRGLKPEVLTQPLKDMNIEPLLSLARRQIATAFGVPQTLLEDAANYATARVHHAAFYTGTVFPEAEIIATNINAQLFAPYEMKFYFERVEAVQQDEATKAAAISQLVQLGIMSVREARQQLGLPEEQEADGAPAAAEVEGTPPAGETPAAPAPAARGLSAEAKRDIARWRRKAARDRLAEFRTSAIPRWVSDAIAARLKGELPTDSVFAPFLRAFDRSGAENEVKERVTNVLANMAKEAARNVGKGDDDWVDEVIQSEEKALNSTLSAILTVIATDVVLDLAAGTGVGVEYDDILTEAGAWARDYSYNLVKQITDSSRSQLQDIISRLVDNKLTREDAVTLISQLFGPVRAQMIATTEVTRAMSQATSIYQSLARERGYVTRRRWLTAEDERVCEICGPLDHKLEDVWESEFPDGPPAHVNCRCRVVLEWVKS